MQTLLSLCMLVGDLLAVLPIDGSLLVDVLVVLLNVVMAAEGYRFGRNPNPEVFHQFHTEVDVYPRPYGGVANIVPPTLPNTTEAYSPLPGVTSPPQPSDNHSLGISHTCPTHSGLSPEDSRMSAQTRPSPETYSLEVGERPSLFQIRIQELYVSVCGKSGPRPTAISEAAFLSEQYPLVGTLQLSKISKDSTR